MSALFMLPEFALFSVFLIILFTIGVSRIGATLASLISSSITLAALIFLLSRPDVLEMSYPSEVFASDRLSLYSRLFWLGAMPFLLFSARTFLEKSDFYRKRFFVHQALLALLGIILAQANEVLLFALTFLAGIAATAAMVVSESGYYRRAAQDMGTLLAMVSISTFFGLYAWIFPDQHEAIVLFGLSLSFSLFLIPKWVSVFGVRAPYSLGLLLFWIFFASFLFWARFGFSQLFVTEKWVVAGVWMLGALYAALRAIQLRETQVWYGFAMYSTLMLGLVPLFSGAEAAISRYIVILPLYLLAVLVGGLTMRHEHKVSAIQRAMVPLVVLMLPALGSSFQDIPIVLSVAYSVCWFLITLSSLQVLFRVLQAENRQENVVKFNNQLSREILLVSSTLVITMLLVIVFRSHIIAAFAQHSLKHLW